MSNRIHFWHDKYMFHYVRIQEVYSMEKVCSSLRLPNYPERLDFEIKFLRKRQKKRWKFTVSARRHVISTAVVGFWFKHSMIWVEWSEIWRIPSTDFGVMVIDGGTSLSTNSSLTISSSNPTRFCPRQTYSPLSDSDIESNSNIPLECWFDRVISVTSFLNQENSSLQIH